MKGSMLATSRRNQSRFLIFLLLSKTIQNYKVIVILHGRIISQHIWWREYSKPEAGSESGLK